MKVKIATIIILFISISQVNCFKPDLGNLSVQFVDMSTGAPLPNIEVNIVENLSPSMTNTKYLASLTTNGNGICEIPKNILPTAGSQVVAIFYAGSTDSATIEYQYLTTNVVLNYPYVASETCKVVPSGFAGFMTQSIFWNNKLYDTLIIKSPYYVTDTIIKNTVTSVAFFGKPNRSMNFNFFSLHNGVENFVYSQYYWLYYAPDLPPVVSAGYYFLSF